MKLGEKICRNVAERKTRKELHPYTDEVIREAANKVWTNEIETTIMVMENVLQWMKEKYPTGLERVREMQYDFLRELENFKQDRKNVLY